MIYDVCVVGSGPANLFAAMEIVNNSNLNLLVLEKARRLNDSRNVAMGWLGGSARSTIKMFVDPGFGGEIKSKQTIETFVNRLENYGKQKVRISKKKLLKRSVKRANDLGFEVDEPETILYTEDKMIKLGDFFYSHLREKATVTHKINITKIYKAAGIFNIITNEGNYQAKRVLLGMGRSGAFWLIGENKEFDLSYDGGSFDFGVRLEFPNYLLKDFADRTTSFRLKFDDFRTTIPIFSGTIETEEVGHIRVSNGRGWNSSKSHMANIGVLKKFETDQPLEDVYRLSEIVNVLSDGQLLRDSMSRVMRGEVLASHLPEFAEIAKGLKKLSGLFPDLKKRCTVYAPEARLNAVRFKLAESMETDVPGLYLVGDMSGKTSSFVQAACSGLLAAENILKESGAKK